MNHTRYFKWDYDSNTVIEYARAGECNGCGACCKALIRFKVATACKDIDPRNGQDATDSKGVWNEINNGDLRRLWQFEEIAPNAEACRDLTDDNKCGVHFDKARICSAWPLAPEHVAPFPDCSYTFTEAWRGKISEPHDTH